VKFLSRACFKNSKVPPKRIIKYNSILPNAFIDFLAKDIEEI
jgi:uncharacterized membrane protein